VETIVGFLHEQDIAGYVWDIEDIPGGAGTPGKRERLVRMLRQVKEHRDICRACCGKLIGAAVPAFISRHPSVPYEEIARETDFLSPMLYNADMGLTVRQCVMRAFREFQELDRRSGLSVVLVPLGQAYLARRGPRQGEIPEFARQTRGYYAISFFSLDAAIAGGLLDELREAAALRRSRER
jgi:hypothetical protein